MIFPQNEIGADVGAIRAYATRVDELGFAHVLAYDHVVGADPAVHEGWAGPYDIQATFHEPMVLFGYIAALTQLEVVTGVIILPQRQTVLVAKQAAAVDVLSEGRFRLGVGVGWNPVEYEALGKNFADRGRRIDDQIALMRRLWTEPTVSAANGEERVVGAGIAPLPVQRPIPIWIGGSSAPSYRRVGRVGDGWFPLVFPGAQLDDARAIVEQSARDAGRDPAVIGMEGRVNADAGVDTLVHHIERWRDVGATHLSINTMRAGFVTVDDHLSALTAAAEALQLAPR